MVSPSSDLIRSIICKGIYKTVLRLIQFFNEYHELKLFWVCYHGTDFKPVQKFSRIMLQIL